MKIKYIQRTCSCCNGAGLIGGFSFSDASYYAEYCPYCFGSGSESQISIADE